MTFQIFNFSKKLNQKGVRHLRFSKSVQYL